MNRIKTFAGALVMVASVGALASFAAPSFGAANTVELGHANVKGKQETVLTNRKGMTLYYFTKDKPNKIACTGHCAAAWPPLLQRSGKPTGPAVIARYLSVVHGKNGPQVEYKGHPLYTFVKDHHPGQATGQGIGGVWYVAVPGMSAAKSDPSASGWH